MLAEVRCPSTRRMSPTPNVWCCGLLAACVALANIAPADATACRIRFVTAQTGSFSTTGDDLCEGWLISPASSTTQQVLAVNSITLIKGTTILAGEADYLDVIVPGPRGGILERRYTSSDIDQLPNRWKLNHQEILVSINAESIGTVVEFRYEADLDEVATFPAIAAVVAAALVIVAFLFTSALCVCRRRRTSTPRTTLVPDTSLTSEEEDRTQTALGDLPTRCWHATRGGAEEECCLCLENFQEGETVRILGCNHYFHKDCIDRWFAAKRRMQRTCPLCKRNPLVTIEGGGEEEIVMDIEPAARVPPRSHVPERAALQHHPRRSAPGTTTAAIEGSVQQSGTLQKSVDNSAADVELGLEDRRGSRQSANAAPAATPLGRGSDEIV